MNKFVLFYEEADSQEQWDHPVFPPTLPEGLLLGARLPLIPANLVSSEEGQWSEKAEWDPAPTVDRDDMTWTRWICRISTVFWQNWRDLKNVSNLNAQDIATCPATKYNSSL